MLSLAAHNLFRRRLRTSLTLIGLAIGAGLLACLLAFGNGYQHGLTRELNQMGIQMMLVPLGCPYDGAARVLKGRSLDTSLPAAAAESARRDPAVAIAAPILMAAVPNSSEGRTDMWEGVDTTIRALKPWWKFTPGSHWFSGPDCVILGSEAAAMEMRRVGDTLYSPETGRRFVVSAILQRSGTSDDSLFFVPLSTAQSMFHLQNRESAVAIRLKDPDMISAASDRLQQIRGAQVVTMTEMLGTFLDLLGGARTLVLAIAILAVGISAISVFNTMLASVMERAAEFGVLRAVGASRVQTFALLGAEGLVLAIAGAAFGLLLAAAGGMWIQNAVKSVLPFTPNGNLMALTMPIAAETLAIGAVVGIAATLYPAWQACRIPPASALRCE
ncbi:MAG TPA: ABC transporter permease [Chthonomonadales bacterium]|nr:ABC transporter permease [Chthonomonadales bacterium]